MTTFARNLISTSDKDEYNANLTSGKNQMSIIELVNSGRTSCFMVSSNIVLRRKAGKYQLMNSVKEAIERRVAYLLCQLTRDLSSGGLNKDKVENAEEILFLKKTMVLL